MADANTTTPEVVPATTPATAPSSDTKQASAKPPKTAPAKKKDPRGELKTFNGVKLYIKA